MNKNDEMNVSSNTSDVAIANDIQSKFEQQRELSDIDLNRITSFEIDDMVNEMVQNETKAETNVPLPDEFIQQIQKDRKELNLESKEIEINPAENKNNESEKKYKLLEKQNEKL
eukprot:165612_1